MASYHSPEKLEKMKLKNRICDRCNKHFEGYGKSHICPNCNRSNRQNVIIIKPYNKTK